MKKKAFTLAEMLIALLIISVCLAALAPVITKRSKDTEKLRIESVNPAKYAMPVGSIILWYGDMIPNGWVACNGQSLELEEFEDLRRVLAGEEKIPDLNPEVNGERSKLKWIIKAQKD